MTCSAPLRAQDGSFEQASADFIQRYLQEWSGPAPAALAYMDRVYPDQVEFYGKALTHAALMELKRRYAARWPERSLSVRPGSIQVLCSSTHLCAVEAIFDWRYKSAERQATSSGSATLKLELQDGMTILAEGGAAMPLNGGGPPAQARRPPIALASVRPSPRPDLPAPPFAEAKPQRDEHGAHRDDPGPPQEEPSPQRDDIAALRSAYLAHAADRDWIAAWLAQKRDFSGQATFVGSTEDQAGPGPAGTLRTDGFISAAGTIACVNPDDNNALKIGEKVNIRGVITIFIDDVMYLGQCSIQPG